MSESEKRKVDYTVMIICSYAKACGISAKEGFFQLLACGGIEILDEFYDIEHTLPVSTTVEDLQSLYARSLA